jgi:hypothetical protein
MSTDIRNGFLCGVLPAHEKDNAVNFLNQHANRRSVTTHEAKKIAQCARARHDIDSSRKRWINGQSSYDGRSIGCWGHWALLMSR